MPSSPSEPRNPLYLLLLLASLVFVLTALAYAVVPALEEKAAEAGNPAPPSALRDALRRDGWKWLLVEVAVMVVLGVASMWLDGRRLRRLQIRQGGGRMPSASAESNPSSTPTVSHEQRQATDRGTAQAD
ncbi:MAG TPA: hypothetical protein VKD72_32355 [Gemmataceae bacterium]|nr:hypothetical protein [Gemmataceae bacterium]